MLFYGWFGQGFNSQAREVISLMLRENCSVAVVAHKLRKSAPGLFTRVSSTSEDSRFHSSITHWHPCSSSDRATHSRMTLSVIYFELAVMAYLAGASQMPKLGSDPDFMRRF